MANQQDIETARAIWFEALEAFWRTRCKTDEDAIAVIAAALAVKEGDKEAALKEYGGHKASCPKSYRVNRLRLEVDPSDPEEIVSHHFYQISDRPCDCGFDAVVRPAAQEPQTNG